MERNFQCEYRKMTDAEEKETVLLLLQIIHEIVDEKERKTQDNS